MRRKNKIVKIAQSLVALCVASSVCFSSVANAYTVSTSGNATISPSKKQFQNAKDETTYNLQSQTISGKISDSYDMNIYHYECPKGGYYQVYTKGNLDTVGALYEENGVFSKSYDLVKKNDYGNITIADNFSMVVDLDKYEDYFACVRGYAGRTGSYSLYIEPNEDKVWKRNYGTWDCQYMPSSAANAGVWTSYKYYLTKEQAILYYWLLDPATTIQSGKVNYTVKQLEKLYDDNASTVVSILTTAISSAVGVNYTVTGITISVVGLFLSETLATGKSAEETMRKELVNKCGVSQVANAATWTGKWSAKNGMLVKETYTGIPGMTTTYSYSKYNGTDVIKGEKWYSGTWKY